jgi:hypothetical protein
MPFDNKKSSKKCLANSAADLLVCQPTPTFSDVCVGRMAARKTIVTEKSLLL